MKWYKQIFAMLGALAIAPLYFSIIEGIKSDNKKKIEHLIYYHGYNKKEAIKELEKKNLLIEVKNE